MNIALKILAAMVVVGSACAYAEATFDISEHWRFETDEDDVGTAERWFASNFDDRGWALLDAGAPWGQQGYEDFAGVAWYRKRVAIPADWAGQKIWLVFPRVVNWFTLYCNGETVAPYGNFGRSLNAPALADLSSRLNTGEDNVIVLRVYGGGASSGLREAPVFLTTDPARIPQVTKTDCFITFADDLATVRVTMRGMGRGSFQGASAEMRVLSPDRSRTVAHRVVPFPAYDMDALATFPLPHTKEPREYPVETVCRDAEGLAIPGTTSSAKAVWPGDPVRPQECEGYKVLNNFVVELLNAKCPRRGERTFSFTNPREGWVFFRVDARRNVRSSDPKLHIDGAEDPLLLREDPLTGDLEAFQYLSRGSHALRVTEAPSRRIIVRRVPELGYYLYPTTPTLPDFNTTGYEPDYSDDFMARHILPNVNVLFAVSKDRCGEMFESWISEGRRWVGRSHMIDLGIDQPKPDEKTYGYWAKSEGVSDPAFSGLIVDEFAHAKTRHFGEWRNALQLLCADPNFTDKKFYAFCGEMYQYEATHELHRFLMEHDQLLAYEQYLSSASNLPQERCYIGRRYVRELGEWQAFSPGVLENMHVCLVLSSMPPVTFDTDPRVNFNVGLDMQMRCMATEPSLQGIYGIMDWSASLADEETLRLAMRMYRHYCIEGKTEPMLSDPFELPHVYNPDFEYGLDGWEVAPVNDDSISRGYIDGFSLVAGRYWPIYKGDTFVSMKRSDEGPNRVSQTIKALKPGALYTLKLHAADLQNLESDHKLGMDVVLEDVEIVDDLCFDTVFRSSSFGRSRSLKQHERIFGTLHRIVFLAKQKTAKLTISDWNSEASPGGRPNQQLACNFVLVRPYHATR
jgi:glycosyl hydrolase family 2